MINLETIIIKKINSVRPYFKFDTLVDNSYMRINRDILLGRLLADLVDKKGLTIVHPGTEQLFISSLIYASLASLFCAHINPIDYLSQFIEGDIVLYRHKRHRFVEITENECILKTDENMKTILPLSMAMNIRLYEGPATSTGSRGIRETVSKANKFLQKWVGVEYRTAANVFPYSVLVVCDKSKALSLLGNLGFIDQGDSYLFSEVFPTAWFSGSNDPWDDLPGNSSRAYPAVMITNRISTARELIYNDRDNRIRSVIINDVHSLLSSKGELQDILDRKSIHDVTMLTPIPTAGLSHTAINPKYCDVIYWSDKVMLSTLNDLYHEPEGENAIQLMQHINHQIDCEVNSIDVQFPFEDDHMECRKLIKEICNLVDGNDDISKFVVCAYGLLNLFEQACFPIADYECAIAKEQIVARSPSKQLIVLKDICKKHENQPINDNLEIIILMLDKMYSNLLNNNPKADKLQFLLTDESYTSGCLEIIVSKRSYIPVVEQICFSMSLNNIVITTPNRLDQSKIFDCIIVAAVPNADVFNPFLHSNAHKTIVLSYLSEQRKSRWNQQEAQRIYNLVNERNLLKEQDGNDEKVSTTTIEDFGIDPIQLDNKIALMAIDVATNMMPSGVKSGVLIHVVRMVVFEGDEWALLSEHYAPYVVDEKDMKLSSKDVGQLQEGDVLVFATQNNDIGNFVDIIVQRLISNGDETLKIQYQRSVLWKTVLKDYMNKTCKSYGDISKMMDALGHPKHQVTVRSWLCEESQIVGPRDNDSFIAIALVTGNEQMQTNPELYKEACDYIRKLRTKILGFVHDQIVHTAVDHKSDKLDEESVSLIGDVSKYARVLRIATIVPVNREVSANIANRPHEG